MSENLVKKAFEIVKSFDNTEPEQYQVLVALAPYLPQELIPEALELVEGMESEIRRSFVLKAIAPYLAKVPTDCGDCKCDDSGCDFKDDEEFDFECGDDEFPTEFDRDTGLLYDNVQDAIDSLTTVLRNHQLDFEDVGVYTELLRQLYVVLQTLG
jgi:NTP pyrophosphatase (non-canonical NTP hydrolase)